MWVKIESGYFSADFANSLWFASSVSTEWCNNVISTEDVNMIWSEYDQIPHLQNLIRFLFCRILIKGRYDVTLNRFPSHWQSSLCMRLQILCSDNIAKLDQIPQLQNLVKREEWCKTLLTPKSSLYMRLQNLWSNDIAELVQIPHLQNLDQREE